jgi:hypothetical protein
MLELYHGIIMEYLDKDYIQAAEPNYGEPHTILPHSYVERPDATSTKCQPVFDGSAHYKGSPSINKLLEVGPNLNPELLDVHLEFRKYAVAFTADLKQAFLQIELEEKDSNAVRFLWVDEPQEPSKAKTVQYRWKRLPFGLTCSPFILRAVMEKHFQLYEPMFPETVRQLRL